MELPTPKPSKAERDERYYQLRNENRIRVYEHLKRKGFSNAAIAGVMANIEVETGGSFNPFQKQTATGKPRSARLRGTGYGLFQLDKGGKRPDYEEWLNENVQSDAARSHDEELQAQLDYMVDSIFKKGKYRDRVGPGNADDVKRFLQKSNDPAQIALEFSNKWEMAGNAHNARRMSEAESILNEINQGKLDRGIISKMFGSYNEGGVAQQMELFEDGGLKDEGGTVDPVSGNDVPSGSTQKEVRDDIPAQLSEGEFVFPADVVRYIGLEKLMQMRQEAKMGLQQMEDMGQMGNSDEATMPDDLPFDIYDLDIDDGPEYNVGGFVPAQPNPYGIAGTQPSQFAQGVGGYTPYQMPKYMTTPVAQAYVPPAQQFVPVQPAPTPLPTTPEFLPGAPTDPNMESVEYINPETGERRVFTFVGDQPTVPIPEGFVPVSEYEAQQPPTTETPVTTVAGRDRVLTQEELRDRDDADAARRQAEIDQYGNASNKIGLLDFYGPGESLTYGVNYVSGFAGGLAGVGQVLKGTLGGGDFPEGSMVLLKNGEDEVLLTGKEYTRFRNVVKEEGTDYSDIMGLIDEGRKRAEFEKGQRSASDLIKSLQEDDDDDDGGSGLTKSQMQQFLDSQRGIEDYSFGMDDSFGMGTKKSDRFEPFPLAEEAGRGTSPRTPDGIPYPGYGQSEVTLTTKPSGASTTYRAEEDPSPPSEGTQYSVQDVEDDIMDSFGGSEDAEDYSFDFGFQQGGLASKKKPKAKKKMKRGGLASKK